MKYIWTRNNTDNSISIGFTAEFCEKQSMECFHVVLVNNKQVVKGKTMLSFETNDGLKTIKSPISGVITAFNQTARDFPDQLTSETEVLRIFPKDSVMVHKTSPSTKEPVFVVDPPNELNFGQNLWQVNFDDLANP